MTIDEVVRDLDPGQRSKLSHELRQPLSAMKTWVELLATTMGNDLTDKQKRYIGKVQEEIRRLTSMLDELSSGPSSGAS